MEKIIKDIKKIINSDISKIIEKRMFEFDNNRLNKESIFKELCFCLMTANFNAKKAIFIQNKIGDGFLNLSEENLAKKLKSLGHRFPNMRAKFIFQARYKKDEIYDLIEKNDKNIREYLVKNIKGLAYKESSHFLRNIGYKDFAIIDFHIVDILLRYGVLKEKKKPINKKLYLEIEYLLREIANYLQITLSELDLYLWYMETDTIFK